jgi:hypothetical protein
VQNFLGAVWLQIDGDNRAVVRIHRKVSGTAKAGLKENFHQLKSDQVTAKPALAWATTLPRFFRERHQ